LFKYIIFII